MNDLYVTPRPEIFTGLAGELVEVFLPHTEADPVAIAAQFLVGLGSLIGRGPCLSVGETPHYLNEFVAIVGASSRSRKGDSKGVALRPLKDADPRWYNNIASGLSSSEGLIYATRDRSHGGGSSGEDPRRDQKDLGVSDKRLLVVETEFAGLLRQFTRTGNTLSPLLRDVWDGKPTLRTLTKNTPLRATDAHISVVAHTTPEDLRSHLTSTEAANGFGNRFLFISAQRSKVLAIPGKPKMSQLKQLVKQTRAIQEVAARVGEIGWTPRGREKWHDVYAELTTDQPGIVGQLLARAEAHVLRLSALYALSTHDTEIDLKHLDAALALWLYSEQSVRLIFCEGSGNRCADRVLQGMPGGTRSVTDIRRDLFSNHIKQDELEEALRLLQRLGHVHVQRVQTGGRPVQLVTRFERAPINQLPQSVPRSRDRQLVIAAEPCAQEALEAQNRMLPGFPSPRSEGHTRG